MNVKSNHSEWCEELASITPDHMERINRRYNTSPNWIYEINHRSWKYESDQWHETLTPSVLFKSENTVTLQMVLHLNSDHLSLLATDALCQIQDSFITLQAIFPDKEITIPVKVCGYQNTVVLKII